MCLAYVEPPAGEGFPNRAFLQQEGSTSASFFNPCGTGVPFPLTGVQKVSVAGLVAPLDAILPLNSGERGIPRSSPASCGRTRAASAGAGGFPLPARRLSFLLSSSELRVGSCAQLRGEHSGKLENGCGAQEN